VRAYLDHASTSPIRPVALDAMLAWVNAADPGRVHTEGRMARAALEHARDQVAHLVGARSRSVVFTSGATEAINAAVFGAMLSGRGGHVVASEVEHSAVRDASRRSAAALTLVGVDSQGRIDAAAIADAVTADTALVHCQWANHEVGALQPVRDVVALCRDRGILVHVDAASAVGHVAVDFDALGADLLSVSAHKFGGPKGAGALLVRRGLRIPALLVGGAQERARRAGLENVAALVGFGAAAGELAGDGRLAAEAADATRRADILRAGASALGGVALYGPTVESQRLPHVVCVGVEGVEAEAVLLGLDQAGVAAHSGSACASETLEPSPVLEAMGVPAAQSLRLSVGWSSTDDDVDFAAAALGPVIERLRALATPNA
jgi:cysteine desulfurase